MRAGYRIWAARQAANPALSRGPEGAGRLRQPPPSRGSAPFWDKATLCAASMAKATLRS